METEIYSQVKRSVRSVLEIDLDHYKDEQMKRRLDSWLVRSGVPTWTDYFVRVKSDDKERSRFRDYLTINVSSFFRDSERWQILRDKVMPSLLHSKQMLRVWSAGCSIGNEPYSLAIMLQELSPHHRHTILATDLDRGALARAKARGPYSANDVQEVTDAQRAEFFETDHDKFFVKESLAKRVEFREQNMLTDPFENNFDLIVCRNVVIYFTEAAKMMLYRKFHGALRPGGILFIGGTEIIGGASEIGLRNYDISFYQKV